MPELRVKKVVTVCFLEAAKLTLEHIAAHRLELSQQGVTGPEELPRLYGDMRRLRDYLQRCASGNQDVVVLDISDIDCAMLVACCRRAVEVIEHRLTERVCLDDERQWLGKKRQVLADWSVEMSAKPLIELPLERVSPVQGEFVRGLNVRIQDKIYGAVHTRQKFQSPTAGPASGSSGGGQSLSRGISSFGEELAGAGPLGGTSSMGMEEAGTAQQSPSTELAVSAPPLMDKAKIRDPRLRSLMTVDLGALERSEAMQDYRMSVVMLASIMESALLDHVIPRRGELGLAGTPDTWAMPDVLIRAMGAASGPKDRSLAFHLFASRNLLRPALQMMTPTVVTATSFDRLREFVARALHALGFGAPSQTLPPGMLSTQDLPQP